MQIAGRDNEVEASRWLRPIANVVATLQAVNFKASALTKLTGQLSRGFLVKSRPVRHITNDSDVN